MLEAGISVLSDVWSRGRLVVLGQGALAASLAFTAWTPHAWGLTLGLALAGASSGVACGAAQALCIVSGPDADRAMVRWSLYSAMGDVLTPLVTASAIALGHSYRGAMAVLALVVGAQCLVSTLLLLENRDAVDHARRDSVPPAEPLRVALARALRLPRLWAWLFAAASCTLLDELVIALAALRLERDAGARPALATAAAVAFSAGSFAGAAMTDGVVAKLSSRRMLATSATLCALALAAFLETESVLASCVALFVVGVTCAPHHPLAMAGAYRELPDHPGTVQAVGQIFVVVDVVVPIALGVVADRFGLGVAMGCLLVQPAVIVACATLVGRREDAHLVDSQVRGTTP